MTYVRIEASGPHGDVEVSVHGDQTLGEDDLEETLNKAVALIRGAYNLK